MTVNVRVEPYQIIDCPRPPVGAVPPGALVYAIGDIHGNLDLLDALHGAIARDADARCARASVTRRVLVYLGDYVSRGPDSRAVLDRLIAGPPDGFEAVCLRGNHEDIVTRALNGETRWARHWLIYGGVAGMTSYGVTPPNGDLDDGQITALMERFSAQFPPEHRRFLDDLTTTHREGDYMFVHAGLRPGVPLERQSAEDCMWVRDEFLNADDDFGVIVVHGHCIFDTPQVRHNRIGIDTGATQSGVLSALGLLGDERWVLQTHTE